MFHYNVHDMLLDLTEVDVNYWRGSWFVGGETWLKCRQNVRDNTRYSYKTHRVNCVGETDNGVKFICIEPKSALDRELLTIGAGL